jgi:glycosyltransferase involved in cell wall biosynthesis
MKVSKNKIAFVHIFRVEDSRYYEALSYILLRLSNILIDQFELVFIYNGRLHENIVPNNNLKIINFDGPKTRTPIGALSILKVIKCIRNICIREKIDIVGNLTDHYLLAPVCIGAKLAKARCIGRVVGILPTGKNASLIKKARKQIARLAERFSLKIADKVLCVSHNLKRQLVERGTEEGKITVISQGVDIHFFGTRSFERLSKKPRSILYVGRLVKNKGVDKGIEAYLRIKKKHPELKFIICGHGKEGHRLMREYGRLKDIRFNGFVPRDKLRDIYLTADILFLPSQSEGLPNVVIEAMASKLPVVATGVGELPNLLSNERGVCTSGGDMVSLSRGLDQMIKNDNLRISCAENAYQYILKNHSFEAVREHTLKFFSDLQNL